MEANIPRLQLIKEVDELLADIKKPETYKSFISLYNDLLILKRIVLTIP